MRQLIALLAIVAGVVVALAITQPVPAPMTQRLNPSPAPVDLVVSRAADASKPGTMRSVMGQLLFTQEPRTTGVSPDTLRFQFDHPARIVGVIVSVDIQFLELVEVAVGINQPVAYGLDARDWLIHTSDARGAAGSKIDEQAWFPTGFEVGPADFVGVGAWLWNGGTVVRAISPEIIIFYEWLP